MSSIVKNYDVVILTHAPKDCIVLSIEKLQTQIIRPSRIVIYNTAENLFYKNIHDIDRFKELINSSNVKVVHIDEDEFDHGKARNDASKLCESDYLLFLTDDAVPYDEFMCEEMIQSFDRYSTASSKVAVVYARQLAKSDAKLKEKYVREFNYPAYDVIKEKSKELELGIKNYYCSNVCAMYDRNIFNTLGQFEENIILNEDTFYVYNAINKGYRVVYSSNAKVYHSHNLGYKEQFSRNFDIGVSQYERKEIFSKIPSTKEGKKMFVSVSKRLLGGLHVIMFIDFVIECFYRYMGFNKGKKFEDLTIDECIRYASNKKYFIKKKRQL